MTLHDEQQKIQSAMNHTLSGLQEDARLAQRILATAKGEEPVKKKLAFTPVLAITILILSVCTALAAGFLWNHPLESELHINDSNRDKYQERQLLSAPKLSETHADITISTDQCVSDEHTAYISFRVNGWTLAEGDQPCFERAVCEPGLSESYSINDHFIGYWSDEKQIEIYTDDDGTLMYCFYITSLQESLIGRTIHIELSNPGIYRKDGSWETDAVVKETWTFDWVLTGAHDALQWKHINQPISDSGFTLDSFSLSPVTAIVTSASRSGLELGDDDTVIPRFVGVVMSDGNEINLTGMPGGDEMLDGAYRQTVSLSRIVEHPEEVNGVLFSIPASGKIIHVALPGVTSVN